MSSDGDDPSYAPGSASKDGRKKDQDVTGGASFDGKLKAAAAEWEEDDWLEDLPGGHSKSAARATGNLKIFMLGRKSKKDQYLITPPYNHSTASRTLDMRLFHLLSADPGGA